MSLFFGPFNRGSNRVQLGEVEMISSKMHLFLLTIIFLEAGVYAYEATPGKDVMGDAPWVVAIDKPIPFLWVFHDCNQNDVDELHCIACLLYTSPSPRD